MTDRLSPPDFEAMNYQARLISLLNKRVRRLDVEIKALESDIVKKAFTDEKYFQGGKPASMEYIKSTYKYAGFNNELLPMRMDLAEIESELEEAKLVFQILRDKVSTYITDAANMRHSVI